MFEITGERHNKLHAALARLAAPSRRWVSLDFFTDAEIGALKNLAGKQTFRTAQSEIVHRENRVFQDFDVCFPAQTVSFGCLIVKLLRSLWFLKGVALVSSLQSLPGTCHMKVLIKVSLRIANRYT